MAPVLSLRRRLVRRRKGAAAQPVPRAQRETAVPAKALEFSSAAAKPAVAAQTRMRQIPGSLRGDNPSPVRMLVALALGGVRNGWPSTRRARAVLLVLLRPVRR